MDIKLNHILYSTLFSGLGVFSFFLLANYVELSDNVSDALYSLGMFLFFIVAFNLLGYSTIHLTTWVDNQYSVNIYRRRKLIFIYTMVMVMFFLLNYGLLVTAKLLVGASHPFVFPNGGWRILIVVWLVELVILGLLLANRSMQHSLKLQKQAATLQEENNIARYTALQNQLNPHFLFNSLNTLISEIRYNPKNAELFTQHLSDVYRYILQCQKQRLVTLKDELGFLDSYIFLHQVRLGNCIHVHNYISDKCEEMKMPPLTLQLLVENVIKHNVIHSRKPMVIELCSVEEPPTLIISNPIRTKKCGVVSGMGLKNLSARYKLLCNRDRKQNGSIYRKNSLISMNKIKVAIIEDEVPAARLLHEMIQSLRPDWEVMILPGTIEESVEWFRTNPHPELLFLDIQLTDGNSFMLIEQARPDSMIVFTTAYDEYAVRAFTVNSIDYLLKPIHQERLLQTIERFENLTEKYIHDFNRESRLLEVLESLSDIQRLPGIENKRYRTRFLISSGNKLFTLAVSDVSYFYSENKLTFVVTKNNKEYVLDFALDKLCEQLDPDMFFRTNRQTLVSVDAIQRIEPYFLGKAVVHVLPPFKDKIIVSKDKIAAFKVWLNY